MYSLAINNNAFRIYRKLPPDVKLAIWSRAQLLRNNPLLGQPLKEIRGGYRSLHLGFKGTQYRIIYQVFPQTKSIIIRLTDKRENIYKRLEQMGN
ncbi:type II toxin-antitoxin system RelE/ParE family toxin [Candidatus Gottesmanbacteria bacterium]|nr:type II toxin-antitoxin system RelE/ParE family toxin [Candidatus Gottesmanbacteria bacterium]